MVEHMECPRAFLGKLVPEHFFFLLRTALQTALSHEAPTCAFQCPQPVTYHAGDKMISYGEIGIWMYIILEGACTLPPCVGQGCEGARGRWPQSGRQGL